MMKYAKNHIPQITEPFEEKLKKIGKGNSGWGSSMHDYTVYVIEFYSTYDGNLVLIENDIRYDSTSRWEVSDSLETFYHTFGEELFEKFFLEVHNIDLKNKEDFTYNWTFGIEEFG